ncbi:MAG: hypothetical protein ACJ8AI_33770 [Rhodopila sp.]
MGSQRRHFSRPDDAGLYPLASKGYNAAFLVLSGVAGLGAALFWLIMPETRRDT